MHVKAFTKELINVCCTYGGRTDELERLWVLEVMDKEATFEPFAGEPRQRPLARTAGLQQNGSCYLTKPYTG